MSEGSKTRVDEPGTRRATLSAEIRDELAQLARGSRQEGTGRLARAIGASLAFLDRGVTLEPYWRRTIARRWAQSRRPALGALLQAIGGDLSGAPLRVGQRAQLDRLLHDWGNGPTFLRDALQTALAALDQRRPLEASARETLEELTGGWFGEAEAVRALLAASGDEAPTLVTPRTTPRPASRKVLRDALAFARDALSSPSEGFRGDVQDALVSLLGEEVEVDDEKIHGDVGQLRFAELREATRALSEPPPYPLPRCALCGEVVRPGEGQILPTEGRSDEGRAVLHDDLPRCALLELSQTMRAWADEQHFDDDQDPAQDTPAQRLMRAYRRVAALVGDGDVARVAWVSCDVCDAFGYGNATCWSCVAHWRWMAPEDRHVLVASLIDRAPGRPCGPEDIQAFLDRVSATKATNATSTSALAPVDYALQDTHRTLLRYYVLADWRAPYGLGNLRDPVSACLSSLESGHPPDSDALRALRDRGDQLAAFSELEGAVAALVRAVEGEIKTRDAQRTRTSLDLREGEP